MSHWRQAWVYRLPGDALAYRVDERLPLDPPPRPEEAIRLGEAGIGEALAVQHPSGAWHTVTVVRWSWPAPELAP